MTDVSLEAIGSHCRGLEGLTLQGCERVSDEGLVALLKRCRGITALNLRGVPDLTEVMMLTESLSGLVFKILNRFVGSACQ